METIALTLAPSPPKPSGGQTSKSRTGDDNAFAPALSDAVAKEQPRDESRSEKSSRKTQSAKPNNTAEKTITASKKDTPSASQTDKTTGKPPTDTTSKIDDTTSTADKPSPPETPPFLLDIGVSGNQLTPSEAVPVPGLQITIEPQSAARSTGKDISFDHSSFDITKNILQDITDLKKDPSTGSQIGDIPSQPVQETLVKQTFQDITLGGQMNPTSRGADKNTLLPVTGQDQSTAPSNLTTNDTQSVNNTGQDTLLAQLQKILTAGGADKAIFVQQPASQNQTAGLDALFPPLYALTDTSNQQTTTIADVSNNGMTTSLSGLSLDKLITGDKNTERVSTTSKDDLQLFLSKAEMQGEKESLKLQEKEAAPQDSSKNLQTTLFNSTSSTDSTGNSSQAGQFSFGSTLIQNMQTGQHLTGTTGSTYLPPWTAVQENSLINQVTQHFQINSGSSTSKLTLKLHPEELGELKIDIQMKDGSIKANIVTQNEQVQQVLEKYIPKLRSFMEQQGLTVDDILVTNTSSEVGKHDLFQEDFVNNHNFSSPENSGKSTSFPDLSFEKDLSEKSGASSGVNVMV